MSSNMNAGADMKTSQLTPSRLVLALLAAGAIGGAGATAVTGGVSMAATAPADGYTIFMGTVGTQVVNPLIYSKLSYDADKFAPVGMVSGSPYVLAVRAGLPAAACSEFGAYAKANPARLNFGSAGNASSPHLGLELLKLTAGLDIVHVPFKSGSEIGSAHV
ncbi:hypothetical protein G6F31_019390 [Rhizopus arrhizus]|nr:hypothetical protein G6F31_019390 [Rhizopus arrhizus]